MGSRLCPTEGRVLRSCGWDAAETDDSLCTSAWRSGAAERWGGFICLSHNVPNRGPRGPSYEAAVVRTCGDAGTASYDTGRGGRNGRRRARRMKPAPMGQSYEVPPSATCGNVGTASYDPAGTARKRVRRASRMKSRRRRPAETSGPLHTTRAKGADKGFGGPVV